MTKPGFVNLLHVLQAEPQADDEIRVLTLEVYEDGFIVRTALPGGMGPLPDSAEEASINPYGLASLTVRDDLNTNYTAAGGGGGGITHGAGTNHYYMAFGPPIPPEAAWLEVLTKGGLVRFDLDEQ